MRVDYLTPEQVLAVKATARVYLPVNSTPLAEFTVRQYKPCRLLNFGCGKPDRLGFFRGERQLLSAGFEVTNYDPFQGVNSENCGKFSIVWANSVLNVMPDDASVLAVIHDMLGRVLPGGYVVASLPNSPQKCTTALQTALTLRPCVDKYKSGKILTFEV